MSMLPSLRGKFNKSMLDADCRAGVDLIKEIKGVASVAFNAASKEVHVTYTDIKVPAEIRKIDGLTVNTRHRL